MEQQKKSDTTKAEKPATAQVKESATAQVKESATAQVKEEEQVMDSVWKFSELPPKAEIVVKNANGANQIINKAAWMSIRANDLDRLEGIELLGVAVRDSDGGFEIEEIEDDFEA